MLALEQRIGALNSAVQDRIDQHADTLAEWFDNVCGAELGDIGTDRLALAPVFVPNELAERLAHCHEAFKKGIEWIFRYRFEGSWYQLAEGLRLTDPVFRYIDPGRKPQPPAIARPDVVIHGDDITMVEPNAGSSCGSRIADADLLGRFFESSPVLSDIISKNGARRFDITDTLIRHMKSMLTAADNTSANPLAVVTEFRAEFGRGPHRLAREMRRHGIRAEAVAVEDLDVSETGIAYGGERCALIYRFAAEEPDPVGNYPLLAPILAAARRGEVLIIDDLDDTIAQNKTILAPLSEELDDGHLPRQLSEELAAFVPWCRILEERYVHIEGERVDLPEWCAKNREDLVLKPGAGYRGIGVLIGDQTEPACWEDRLNAALSSPDAWIVQRLARSEPTTTSTVRSGSVISASTYVDYSYFAIADTTPAGIVRRGSRFGFGESSRVVKSGPYGPAFIV
jgi:hypothetical protein